MVSYIPKCQATLRKLLEKLGKCEQMGLRDRIKFIATDFEQLRQELRNHQQNISAQLHIGADNALGRLLEIVSKLAADIREGRRSTVITTRGKTIDDLEETRTLVEVELRSVRDIPGNEIELHRPVVERYVQMLSERGGFEEPIPQRTIYPEIGPDDSASVLSETLSESSKSYRQHLTDASDSGWPKHRGIPIDKISYETIFNPNVDSRGFPKPNTCNIWGLTSACWRLQALCAEKLKLDVEGQDNEMSLLQDVSDALAKFAPVLLWCLANSSTNRNFWVKLRNRNEVVVNGNGLLKSLIAMTRRVRAYNPLSNKPHELLLTPTTTKITGIKRIFRSRSTASLKQTQSMTTSMYNEMKICGDDLKQRPSDFCYGLGENLKPYIRYRNLSRYHDLSTMTEVEFSDEIKAINEHWHRNYEAARSLATGAEYSLEGSEEDGQLLTQWLLAAQGLDSQQGSSSGLDRLLGQLTFEINPAAEQARLDFQLQKLQEINLRPPLSSFLQIQQIPKREMLCTIFRQPPYINWRRQSPLP